MSTWNKQIVLGYVSRDAEVKTIPGGSEVVEFGMYTKEYVGKDTDLKTEFFDVSSFQKNVLTLAKNGKLTKGTCLYVEGRNESREFESKGVKQKRWTIRANEVKFAPANSIGGNGEGDGGHTQQSSSHSSSRTSSRPAPQAQASSPAVDDDCPF